MSLNRVVVLSALLLGGCPEPGGSTSCDKPVLAYVDDDGDGFGDLATEQEICGALSDGLVELAGDCDDTDPDISPDAVEACDDRDNNCDGSVDEGLDRIQYYPDSDGDGFGVDAGHVFACARPEAHVRAGGDCDDTDAAVNPDATEVCDGFDNDCDDWIDDLDDSVDPASQTGWYDDEDVDGYGGAGPFLACVGPARTTSVGGDCDDFDGSVNPGELEQCGGVDEDCDGLLGDADDNVDPASMTTWFYDGDGDGYGVPDQTEDSCRPGERYVDNDVDCDDTNPLSATFVDWYVDGDGDGVGDGFVVATSCLQPMAGTVPDWMGIDCDDGDALRFPGNPEVCEDGIDNDCSTATGDACSVFFEDFEDGDYAGWSAPVSGQTPNIDAIGADGTDFSFRMDGGGFNHYLGIYWSFAAPLQPSEIRYKTRTNGTNGDRGYVVFGGSNIANGNTAAFCWFSGALLQCYDGSAYYQRPLTVNAWHEVVFRIDWAAQRFDFVVDGTSVANNIPFRGFAPTLQEFHLYNYNSTNAAWWDQIEMIP